MNIEITFMLSTGGTYANSINTFASLGECRREMAVLLESDGDSITFEGPGGDATVLASRHIIGVTITPAGAQ